MHPHNLHARTAAWSLAAARPRLRELTEAEAENIAAEQSNRARDGLRSAVLGGRGGRGGHGDPTSSTALLEASGGAPRPNRYAQRQRWTLETLEWLTRHPAVNATGQGDPLDRLMAVIPRLTPEAAAVVTLELRDEDRRVRQLTGAQPDRQPVAVECPACRARGVLYVATCGPEEERTVVCGAGCVCLGPPNTRLPDAEREPGCPCGMPMRVEGVGHIWDRTAFAAVGAVAGNAPTGTTN